LGNLFQVGFLFTVKPLKPDIKRIVPNFGRFIKRAFFSGEAFFNLAKSIFKVVVIGVIAYLNIKMEVDKFIHFVTTPFWLNFATIAKVAFRILVEASLGMLVLAIPDYLFQRKQHRESLKMTKHEVKEERKMYEGDPLMQNRLRERMREMLSQNMLQNVPQADVVVTNPTHYAVAMQWEQHSMSAPMVTAKGQDNIAQKMREIAQQNEVPIIENKPLARALYQEVEIGDSIPEKYWEVVALVLAEVYKMSGKTEAVG
jgi:flagellar biosynthetic protein FlhB